MVSGAWLHFWRARATFGVCQLHGAVKALLLETTVVLEILGRRDEILEGLNREGALDREGKPSVGSRHGVGTSQERELIAPVCRVRSLCPVLHPDSFDVRV